jgi:hypothetical protein
MEADRNEIRMNRGEREGEGGKDWRHRQQQTGRVFLGGSGLVWASTTALPPGEHFPPPLWNSRPPPVSTLGAFAVQEGDK